jgi:hypothetical protein
MTAPGKQTRSDTGVFFRFRRQNRTTALRQCPAGGAARMTDMDQDQRVEERCPNDRFPIRKRPLRVAPTNDRYWPIPAVPIQSSPMSELGQQRTLQTALPYVRS